MAFNPPLAGMVVETTLRKNYLNCVFSAFNPPLAGMVVETHFLWTQSINQFAFNPPLAGMVVETLNLLSLTCQ